MTATQVIEKEELPPADTANGLPGQSAKKEGRSSTSTQTVTIRPPGFQTARFKIIGIAPLVIRRFSTKTKDQLLQKQVGGKASSSKKNRDAQDVEATFNEARYISKDGWDGFQASCIRNAMISACRLVNFKMTLAKLSIFVIQDGWDAKEPQIPLIRIHGEPVMQEDIGRVETGAPYVTIRPAYHEWHAFVNIRWDADQFSIEDVTNLLSRVGMQVGIGEGRPDSKNSAGCGWGMFEIEQSS